MFDGFLMSISNKLKKISASLDLYEGKFDEISTDVGTVNTAVSNVGTKVDAVQTASDEIKSLVSSEVATAKDAILNELNSSNSSDESYVCTASSTVLTTVKSSLYTVSGESTTLVNSCLIKGFHGTIRILFNGYSESASYVGCFYIYRNGVQLFSQKLAASSTSYTYDLLVNDGDIVEFYLRGGSRTTSSGSTTVYNGYCNNIQICGTISQYSDDYGITVL